jgi:hypothetical protein
VQIQGSLHCAAHDKTVSSFGRDDVSFDNREENVKTNARGT